MDGDSYRPLERKLLKEFNKSVDRIRGVFVSRYEVELSPDIYPADILYSQALGWGLKGTITLAEVSSCCDFRFKKDVKTQVAVPEPIRSLLAGRS
jgi:hypothetical protein